MQSKFLQEFLETRLHSAEVSLDSEPVWVSVLRDAPLAISPPLDDDDKGEKAEEKKETANGDTSEEGHDSNHTAAAAAEDQDSGNEGEAPSDYNTGNLRLEL